MICVGFCHEDDGIFRGGDGELLLWNVVACLAITAWSGGLTAIVFLVLKYTIGIRMSLDNELKGSDFVEHNILEQQFDDPAHKNHSLGKHVEYTPRYTVTVENSC